MLILPPKKESKFGSKEPQNRQKPNPLTVSKQSSALDFLLNLRPSPTLATDLKNAERLDALLGFPSRAYPVIHIAGSNGKGSVATKIAKALELAGYRVGLYTSPHLYSFQERICINSEQIPEKAILRLPLEPVTFFEYATFLAFDYFRREKVDVAVVETGLGGRFDATNVVTPYLSVITSISREHCAILGEDLEKIAAEKAGIIKPKVPVVIGPNAQFQAIAQRAKELEAPLFISKKTTPFYDEENRAIAELSLTHLRTQFSLSEEAIQEGIAVRPACRFERREFVIFDVAHNPDGISHLIQALTHFYPGEKLHFLAGFSKDKEIATCLGLIAKVASRLHLVEGFCSRAARLEEIKHCAPASSILHPNVEVGMEEAMKGALEENALLIVCGSFYLMEPARNRLSLHFPALRQ